MSDFSPKQVARAIGVSESSLKRWCDQGLIPVTCTVGGHRRLPLSGVLEFLRTSKHPLLHPEEIGLPLGAGRRKRTPASAAEALQTALIAADDVACRQILLDLFLEGQRLSRIFDETVAPAFQQIGQRWECGEVEIYRERRACRICVRVLHELRSLLPPPPAAGRLAMGGTPAGDFYDVPTMLVELVLRQNGWQAASLGSSLPAETLIAAIRDNQPKLFWLSVSHIADEAQFLADYRRLYEAADQTMLVVGGRALTAELRKQMQYTAYCDNLQHLEALLAGLPGMKPAPAAALGES